MNHAQQLESILFTHGDPVSVSELCRIMHITKEELETAIEALRDMCQGHGIVLLRDVDTVTLATHPDATALLDAYRKEELSTELSKASLETLAIILYKDTVTRGEIDFIRGVNSQFILRNLVVRGLIERIPDPSDSRRLAYKPTLDVLRFLGVTDTQSLPEYAVYMERLQEALKTNSQQ